MSDEYAAERAYAECDPLGLDAGAMRNDDVGDALAVVLDDFSRRVIFYRGAISEALEDPWKAKTFGGMLHTGTRLIEVAGRLLEEGQFDAAEFVLKEAIDDYQSMIDRIDDWRTDALP